MENSLQMYMVFSLRVMLEILLMLGGQKSDLLVEELKMEKLLYHHLVEKDFSYEERFELT